MKVTANLAEWFVEEIILSPKLEMWLRVVMDDEEAIAISHQLSAIKYAAEEGVTSHKLLKEEYIPRLQLFQLLLREIADVIKRLCDKVSSDIDRLKERGRDE